MHRMFHRLARFRWPHLFLLALLPVWWQASRPLGPSPTLGFWLVFNALYLAAWERLHPYRREWHADKAHLRHDGSIGSLVLATDMMVGALIALAIASMTPETSRLSLELQVFLGILVGEFASYWLHRVSHRNEWMWRVHLLHHRPGRVNVANALTAHPINAAWDKLARTVPLCLLGLHADAITLVALFALTQTLIAHANVAGTLGWLDHVLGGPSLHRLHHSTQPEQAGNYGTTITLWDHLFGTFVSPAPVHSVGTFGAAPYPAETQTKALLCYPFAGLCRRLSSTCASWMKCGD